MGKANISFPEGMLEDVDRRAAATGITRSSFIQEATARYLEQLDHEHELDARKLRIERAIEGMRKIGDTLAPGPDGLALIRTSREKGSQWSDSEEPNDQAGADD